MTKQTLSVKIDPEVKTAIEEYSEKSFRSESNIVRKAISDFFEDKDEVNLDGY